MINRLRNVKTLVKYNRLLTNKNIYARSFALEKIDGELVQGDFKLAMNKIHDYFSNSEYVSPESYKRNYYIIFRKP